MSAGKLVKITDEVKRTQVRGFAGLASNREQRDTRGWEDPSKTRSTDLVGATVGSYVLARLLGEGGVGAVYLGEHPVIGSRVAVKVLHHDFATSIMMLDRFIQEARAANAIPSPHIVRVFDFGKLPDGRPYAVMECLEGESLEAVLERERVLPVARALRILCQVAETMVAAHERGIVHRDLKPENIFIERSREADFVRILDFGIAKLFDPETGDPKATTTGLVVGTPLYCAPEQAAGTGVTPASDTYALGVVAYEMLSGSLPYEGNVVQVLMQKMNVDVPPLHQVRSDVPTVASELVHQMLERDINARPSMADVVLRLRAELGVEPSSTPAPLGVHTTSTEHIAFEVPKLRLPRVVMPLAFFACMVAAFFSGQFTAKRSAQDTRPTAVETPLPAMALPSQPPSQPVATAASAASASVVAIEPPPNSKPTAAPKKPTPSSLKPTGPATAPRDKGPANVKAVDPFKD